MSLCTFIFIGENVKKNGEKSQSGNVLFKKGSIYSEHVLFGGDLP